MGVLRRLSTAVPPVLFLVLPAAAAAWGPTGHRVVGQIAEDHLSAAARRGVEALIGPESLAEAATWADEIRSDPTWDKAAPWHYISIDDGETLETTRRSSDGDVLWAIHHFSDVLRSADASHEEKGEALKFLVHFVGDVHQPLHVGRRADQGGNSVQVSWFGETTNLHRVWDSEMIDHEGLSFTELRPLPRPPDERGGLGVAGLEPGGLGPGVGRAPRPGLRPRRRQARLRLRLPEAPDRQEAPAPGRRPPGRPAERNLLPSRPRRHPAVDEQITAACRRRSA